MAISFTNINDSVTISGPLVTVSTSNRHPGDKASNAGDVPIVVLKMSTETKCIVPARSKPSGHIKSSLPCENGVSVEACVSWECFEKAPTLVTGGVTNVNLSVCLTLSRDQFQHVLETTHCKVSGAAVDIGLDALHITAQNFNQINKALEIISGHDSLNWDFELSAYPNKPSTLKKKSLWSVVFENIELLEIEDCDMFREVVQSTVTRIIAETNATIHKNIGLAYEKLNQATAAVDVASMMKPPCYEALGRAVCQQQASKLEYLQALEVVPLPIKPKTIRINNHVHICEEIENG
jgi:hypothetical protein